MRRSIVAVENLLKPSVEEVAYWHLKFLYSSRPAARERLDFVQQAAIKARLGVTQQRSLEPALAG